MNKATEKLFRQIPKRMLVFQRTAKHSCPLANRLSAVRNILTHSLLRRKNAISRKTSAAVFAQPVPSASDHGFCPPQLCLPVFPFQMFARNQTPHRRLLAYFCPRSLVGTSPAPIAKLNIAENLSPHSVSLIRDIQLLDNVPHPTFFMNSNKTG